MANLVQSLLTESAQTAFSDQHGVAQKLAKKWAKSGLLEGLQNYDANNMAVILENQAKQLVVESTTTNGNTAYPGGATFTPGTGEQWAGVALPLVRKIFGQIASKEFVSVQPMNLPAGLVFYLDFQYGNSKTPFATGDSVYGTPSANFGNYASGALYGPGKFGYSLNQFSASVSSSVSTFQSASATWAQVDFDSNYSQSVVNKTVTRIAIPTSSIDSQLNQNGVRAFIILPSGSNATQFGSGDNLQAFTAISSSAAGEFVTFFINKAIALGGNGSATNNTYVVYYNKQTDFNSRGDFEDRSGLPSVPNAASATSIVIPEINVQMKSQTISAKTRKLKAQWTPEFAQDLNAYHSLDAEAELTGLLSEHISLEIDLEILDMLIQNAPTIEYWSAQVGQQINATNTAFTSNTSGVYYTQMSWFQTLGIKLQKVSNIIHQRTLRGGANFMVVSPTVATILESIPGFAADTDGAADTMKYAFGVQKIGQLNSRYKVYKNPYMIENAILLGFRGNQFLECGAVYSPYVPLIMTPLVYDPNTFTPRKGIMTRYAMTMVRPEYYGLVFVADLNVI
jgi:Major capsid protein Gp23